MSLMTCGACSTRRVHAHIATCQAPQALHVRHILMSLPRYTIRSSCLSTANHARKAWGATRPQMLTILNIPLERLECNYIGGTGRCGGDFRLASLQIQGSEDFSFGYQVVTKKWRSQLFRNRLIGCFYLKNAGTLDGSRIFFYLCSKAQRSEMVFPNGKRVCTPKSLSRLMTVKTTLNKSDSLRPNRLITNLHKGRGASRKAFSPFFRLLKIFFSLYACGMLKIRFTTKILSK